MSVYVSCHRVRHILWAKSDNGVVTLRILHDDPPGAFEITCFGPGEVASPEPEKREYAEVIRSE